MGLKRERYVFGIHSITPYRRADMIPYGILQVLGGANLELTGESEDLYGGASRFAFASEPTQISSSVTANVKSYPNFLMELFLGGSVTSVVASATGEVRDFANVKGTSAKESTTGIANVTVVTGDAADLKFGKYLVVVLDATHVDVYCMSNIDFNRGADLNYIDDSLKVASNVVVASGGDTALADLGFKLVGGSGTIAMTPGDSAEFDVYPPHTGISQIDVGSSSSEFPEFGAFFLASKSSARDIFQIQAYRCSGSGMPIPLQEKAYAISDLTIKLLQDSTKNKVFRITHIEEVS